MPLTIVLICKCGENTVWVIKAENNTAMQWNNLDLFIVAWNH